MGTFLFFLFSIFYFLFSFLRAHKKRKNANKEISYFSPLRCFLSAFLIFVCLFAFWDFAWLRFVLFGGFCAFDAFCSFWCFWCLLELLVRAKSFCKKITSFILLLARTRNGSLLALMHVVLKKEMEEIAIWVMVKMPVIITKMISMKNLRSCSNSMNSKYRGPSSALSSKNIN